MAEDRDKAAAAGLAGPDGETDGICGGDLPFSDSPDEE
jgi:hypothetical protein